MDDSEPAGALTIGVSAPTDDDDDETAFLVARRLSASTGCAAGDEMDMVCGVAEKASCGDVIFDD